VRRRSKDEAGAECAGLPDSVSAWNAKNRSFLQRESHHGHDSLEQCKYIVADRRTVGRFRSLECHPV
jgi:hypothetical protein